MEVFTVMTSAMCSRGVTVRLSLLDSIGPIRTHYKVNFTFGLRWLRIGVKLCQQHGKRRRSRLSAYTIFVHALWRNKWLVAPILLLP